jgi:hypothetical protein
VREDAMARIGFSDLGRFSDVSLLILLSLAAGEKHGYAIIEDIERFSGMARSSDWSRRDGSRRCPPRSGGVRIG